MSGSASQVDAKAQEIPGEKELILAFLLPPAACTRIAKAVEGFTTAISWLNSLHCTIFPLGTHTFASAKHLVAELGPTLSTCAGFPLRAGQLQLDGNGVLSLALEPAASLNGLRAKIFPVLQRCSVPPSQDANARVVIGRLTAFVPPDRIQQAAHALGSFEPVTVDALTVISHENGQFGALHRFTLAAPGAAGQAPASPGASTALSGVVAMEEETLTEGDGEIDASLVDAVADLTATATATPAATVRPAPLALSAAPADPTASLELGTVLLARGVHRCELAWSGRIDGRQLLGVVYDGPKGNSDGTFFRAGQAVRCFTCPPRHGEFLEATQVAVFDRKVQAAARIQRAFRGHFSRQRRRELINQEVWNLLDQKKENETLHAREIYARLAERFRGAGHSDSRPSSTSSSALPALPSLATGEAQSSEADTKAPTPEKKTESSSEVDPDSEAMPPLLTLQHQDSDNWSPPLASPGGTRLPPPRLPSGPITLSFVLAALTHFRAGGLLHVDDVATLLHRATEMLELLDNVVVLPVYDKITVCGDIHGQLDDLCFIFNDNGLPSETNPYLFNGDFVDRGQNSCECVLTLLAFKLLLPNHFHLNRGNHESQALHRVFGFEEEVVAKYGRDIYEMFIHTFARLPIAHVVQEKVFVVHGGPPITQDLTTIARMKPQDRFHVEVEDPAFPAGFREMLWNDPQDHAGARPSDRGCGYTWGPDVTQAFLRASGLALLLRAHEIRPAMFATGFQVHAEHNDQLLTLFSASNYCGRVGNHAAFAVLRGTAGELPELVSFMATARDRETFEPHRAHRNDVIEADIVAQLRAMIADQRLELLKALEAADTTRAGTISRLQAEHLVLQVLKLPQLPLFLYAEGLGLPSGNRLRPLDRATSSAAVHYRTWLDGFKPCLSLFDQQQETDTAAPGDTRPAEAKAPSPFARSSSPSADSKAAAPAPATANDGVDIAAQFIHTYRNELETLFRRFDRGLTGHVDAKAFRDAVTQLNEAQGRPLSQHQVSLLLSAFEKLSPAQRKYDTMFRPAKSKPSGSPRLAGLKAPQVTRAQSHGATLQNYAPLTLEPRRPSVSSAAPQSGKPFPVSGHRASHFPVPRPQAAASSDTPPPHVLSMRRQHSEPARRVQRDSSPARAQGAPAATFFQLLSSSLTSQQN